MARYFRVPFAVSGDKDTIPDPPDNTDGTVSYTEGYGDNYSLNPATEPEALNVERDMFNQLAFDITSTLQLYYQTGVPPFITTTDNGGTAHSYARGARVRFNDRVYESLSSGNTNDPTDTSSWALVDRSGLDSRFLRRSSNLSDLTNEATARNNLELGTAAIVNTGTGSANVPTTSQSDARYARQSNNLSDLDNATTARSNLNLGTAATRNTGTGDDQIRLNSGFGTASELDTGTGSGDIRTNTQNDSRFLRISNNLSEGTATDARTNLELGSAATQADTRYNHRSNNLSDIASATTARSNLGLDTASVQPDTRYCHRNNNLDDLESATSARTNLELGSAATRSAGTALSSLPRVSEIGLDNQSISNQSDSSGEFSDPDSVNRNGLFYFGTGTESEGFPSDGSWFLFSMVHGSSSSDPNSGIKSQIAVRAGEDANKDIFVRGQDRDKSTWSDWENLVAALIVLINFGFGEFFANFHGGNFFAGMY